MLPELERSAVLDDEEDAPVLALLIDMLLVGVVVGCAWIGSSLGLAHSTIRTISFFGSFIIAMLIAVPAGQLVAFLSPLERDTARLIGVLVAAVGAYVALASLGRWCFSFVDPERSASVDGSIGGGMGALLGLGWGIVMVVLVMLVPLTGSIPEATIRSNTGSLVLRYAPSLVRSINTTFPHYTQTLPKGSSGAQTHDDSSLTLAQGFDSQLDPDVAGELFANINQWRLAEDRIPVAWSPEIADVAARHSRSMLDDAYLDTDQMRAGSKIGTFEDQMLAALGDEGDSFTVRHEIVVWAHGTGNAMAALTTNRKLRSMIDDRDLVAIGVGAARGGWFNGTMFTIGIVGKERPAPLRRAA